MRSFRPSPRDTRTRARALFFGYLVLLLLSSASPADLGAQQESNADRASSRAHPSANADSIDRFTWMDHDAKPIREPKEREKSLTGHQFREGIIEPLSHAFDIPDKILWLTKQLGADTDRQAVNVNAYDEVPNSTWYTNRNHLKAVTLAQIRVGAIGDSRPKPPYSIVSAKTSGVNPGFTIKDSQGRRWVVKLDTPGSPQLGSGADVVVSRILWASGYNVSHDIAFSFHREDLTIDDELRAGKKGAPFTEAALETLLTLGHRSSAGLSYGQASLHLPGKPIGHIDMRSRRPDDPNDRYSHPHRRELRGLYVLVSWLQSWDTKDHQSLEMFVETKDSVGHVNHYLLDFGAALGASAEGPKAPSKGFEHSLDWKWITRRLFSFGFVVEPWREAKQETGIPSVGNFESQAFHPDRFRSLIPHPAFRERTDRDCYWGAKLVASFSDAQIEAAVQAAGYEDPRASDTIARVLRERRDKVARYWFGKVAPVDFFHVEGGTLHFQDLAVDRSLERPRRYEAHVDAIEGTAAKAHFSLQDTVLPLDELGGDARRVRIELSVEGSKAAPASVELARRGGMWVITRVTHG